MRFFVLINAYNFSEKKDIFCVCFVHKGFLINYVNISDSLIPPQVSSYLPEDATGVWWSQSVGQHGAS